jgi:RepA leader peptide Tap
MLRKLQYQFLCHLLLPCNISAGWVTEQHNPQHWSQLDTEEQIRFWQGVEDGHVESFWFPEKKYPSPSW